MKNLSFSLLKYFSLLLALIFTAGYLFYGTLGKSNLIILQLIFGIIYVTFSVLEFTKQLEKVKLPNDRFFYFPLSFLASKFIKLGAFTLACILLFLSKSNLVFLAGLLLTVILSDVLIFLLRIGKKVYYVSMFANYVLFSLEDEKRVFASHIKIVEYRYGIFYLQLTNGKIYTIEVERIEKTKQKLFIEKMVLWVLSNNLQFTDEAKAKLVDIISTTN